MAGSDGLCGERTEDDPVLVEKGEVSLVQWQKGRENGTKGEPCVMAKCVFTGLCVCV